MWYLEDLVGTAHGGDFVVGMGSSQLAEVTHRSFADFTVHVHLLHLMLRTHEHLGYLTEQHLVKLSKENYKLQCLTAQITTCWFSDQKLAEVKQEHDLYFFKKKHLDSSVSHFLKCLKIEAKFSSFLQPRSP